MPSLATMLGAWQAAALFERGHISHASNVTGMGLLTTQEALLSNAWHKDRAMDYELRAQTVETFMDTLPLVAVAERRT